MNSGAQTCTVSSEQFKHDIMAVSESDASAIVSKLNLVTFKYDGSDDPRLGLVAEQVAQIDPRLVFRDASSTVRGVRYEDLTAVLASVVRENQQKFDELTGATPAPWFVAAVGKAIAALGELTATHITVTNDLDVQGAVHAAGDITSGAAVRGQELCAGSTCVTEAQLPALLAEAGSGGQVPDLGGSPSVDEASSTPDTTPPVITIHGNNPATIAVGTAYADLGATATDDSGSAILRTYQDGREVSAVRLDTSLAGAHVIAYVAHDPSGNVATSTREVFVKAATSTAALGGPVASSTPANDNLPPEEVASSSATSTRGGGVGAIGR